MHLRSIVCACLALSVVARSSYANERLDRALAEQKCNAQDPSCDWIATLSSIERVSVQHAIAARGYVVEPSPWGKVIGRVEVFNEDVFTEQSRVLRFLNRFHVTTKEFAIQLETVVSAGEVWDQERIEETARRLRDPLWSSVVVVIPIKSSEPGKVDVLVVTRDVWSLRLNTRYTYQQSKLTDLRLALSENNFLGTRRVLALALTMDQGAIASGPLFIDKNLFGKHVELQGRFDMIVNRDDLLDALPGVDLIRDDKAAGGWTYEGTQSVISITKPLWSLASKWGGGVSFDHRIATNRSFFGTGIRPVRCPLDGSPCATIVTNMPDEPGEFDPDTSPAEELLPVEYGLRSYRASAFTTRQLGNNRLKHQIALSLNFSHLRSALRDDWPGVPEQREAFATAVLPLDATTTELAASYSLFTPRFRTLRNVRTYDLAEDIRFGPDWSVNAAVGYDAVREQFVQRASTSFGWTFPWCRDGFVNPSATIGGRRAPNIVEGETFIDNSAAASLRIVTPTFYYARLVAVLSTGTRWNPSRPGVPGYQLGSDDGLRGYVVNEFAGERFARGQFEVRSTPWPLWFLRIGAVMFYDAAAVTQAWRTFNLAQHYHHDVGVGARVLMPQTSRELFRFDLAFPINSGNRTVAGTPQFIASFEQAF